MENPNRLYDRYELEQRIEKLWQQHPYALGKCLARHAIRCLPVLGLTVEPFSFWPESDESSQQSEVVPDLTNSKLNNLLSLHYAAQLTLIWSDLSTVESEPTASPDEGEPSVDPGTIQNFKFGARNVREQMRNVESNDSTIFYACAYAADAAIYCANAESPSEIAPYAATALDKLVESDDWTYTDLMQSEFQGLGSEFVSHFIESFLEDLTVFEESQDLNLLKQRPIYSDKFLKLPIKELVDAFLNHCNKLLADLDASDQTALNNLIQTYSDIWGSPEADIQEKTEATPVVSSETSRNKEVDKLGRTQLVEGLANILSFEDNVGHLTIGLFGHWGSGKTRVIDLLKEALNSTETTTPKKTTHFLYGEFNAWRYEHSKNIQAAMAHEIIKALTQNPVHKTKSFRYLKGMANRVRVTFRFVLQKHPRQLFLLLFWLLLPFAVFFGISSGEDVKPFWQEMNGKNLTFGVSLPFAVIQFFRGLREVMTRPFTKELMSYLKLPSYAEHIGMVSEMTDDIKKMCKASLSKKRRLLFVVDDLDRCGPEGIIKTFEAIRLVLDIAEVRVLIAVDQRIALAALAYNYSEIAKHHELNDAKAIAHDYLGKMIHIPIKLSEPIGEEMKDYMAHVWNDEGIMSEFWRGSLDVDEGSATAEYDLVDDEVVDDDLSPSDLPTLEQLNEWIGKLPEINKKPKAEVKVSIGMSSSQKAAFVYWANRFGISNPRQLKRLNNSYNLIRLVSDEEDILIDAPNVQHPFGLLICLFLLEFINGQEDSGTRFQYRQVINRDFLITLDKSTHQELFELAMKVIDETVRQRPRFKKRKNLIEFVDQFVLPAIAQDEEMPIS